MSTIVSTFYWNNFQELAKKTVDFNLKLWCERHGYTQLFLNLGAPPDVSPNQMVVLAGRKNTEIALKTLERFPNCEWFFHRDCDSIITNMKVKLRSPWLRMEKDSKTFDIYTGSDKAGPSMGQWLIRNTDNAKKYLREILAGIESGQYEHEQDFLWKNSRDFIFNFPQRVMNSYDTDARLEPFSDSESWHEGDFLVHMAGMTLEQRMSRLDYWMGKVSLL